MNTKDRVTIYQVAQAAGVSLATVSRVINKQGNVTEATRLNVEETIKRLGYKPSGLAQALATNKSTNIGVIIPNANYVYISNLLAGISDVAKTKGFVLSLFTTSHSREEALSMIEKVITSHVDGAIIASQPSSSIRRSSAIRSAPSSSHMKMSSPNSSSPTIRKAETSR